jgi:hypothetical protein
MKFEMIENGLQTFIVLVTCPDKLDGLEGDVVKGVEDVRKGSQQSDEDHRMRSSRIVEDQNRNKTLNDVFCCLFNLLIDVRTIVQDSDAQCEKYWCVSRVLSAMWTYHRK